MVFNNGDYVASDLMITLNTIEEVLLLSCLLPSANKCSDKTRQEHPREPTTPIESEEDFQVEDTHDIMCIDSTHSLLCLGSCRKMCQSRSRRRPSAACVFHVCFLSFPSSAGQAQP